MKKRIGLFGLVCLLGQLAAGQVTNVTVSIPLRDLTGSAALRPIMMQSLDPAYTYLGTLYQPTTLNLTPSATGATNAFGVPGPGATASVVGGNWRLTFQGIPTSMTIYVPFGITNWVSAADPLIQTKGVVQVFTITNGAGAGVTNSQVLPGTPSSTNGNFVGTFTGSLTGSATAAINATNGVYLKTILDPVTVSGATNLNPVVNGTYYYCDSLTASWATNSQSSQSGCIYSPVYTNRNGSLTNMIYAGGEFSGWVLGTNVFDQGSGEGLVYANGGTCGTIANIFGNHGWTLPDGFTPDPNMVVNGPAPTPTLELIQTVTNSSYARSVSLAALGCPTCSYPGIGRTLPSGPSADQYIQIAFNKCLALGIDTIELPEGIIRLKSGISMPNNVRGIVGHSTLHSLRTGRPEQDSKPFSQIWIDNTNVGSFGISGNAAFGKIHLSNFEICGCTNPVASSGNDPGFDLKTLPSSAFAEKGIVLSLGERGFSGGDWDIENVSVKGFRMGFEFFGNSGRAYALDADCCDLSFMHTNNFFNDFNIDQLTFENCGVGLRNGSLGYFFHNVNDCRIINPSDFYYYCFAVLDASSISIQGGNSELQPVAAPTWSIHRQSNVSFYPTNKWDYPTNAAIVCIGQSSRVTIDTWRADQGPTTYIPFDISGSPGSIINTRNFLWQNGGNDAVQTNRDGTIANFHQGQFNNGLSFFGTNYQPALPNGPVTPGGCGLGNSNATPMLYLTGPGGVAWTASGPLLAGGLPGNASGLTNFNFSSGISGQNWGLSINGLDITNGSGRFNRVGPFTGAASGLSFYGTNVGSGNSLNSFMDLTASGLTLNVGVYSGSGASLTALNASSIGSGTVPNSALPNPLPALVGAITGTSLPLLTTNASGIVPTYNGNALTNLNLVGDGSKLTNQWHFTMIGGNMNLSSLAQNTMKFSCANGSATGNTTTNQFSFPITHTGYISNAYFFSGTSWGATTNLTFAWHTNSPGSIPVACNLAQWLLTPSFETNSGTLSTPVTAGEILTIGIMATNVNGTPSGQYGYGCELWYLQ